jgi:hypothetical protein
MGDPDAETDVDVPGADVPAEERVAVADEVHDVPAATTIAPTLTNLAHRPFM